MTDEQRKQLFTLLRGALQASVSGYEARRCDLDERLFDVPSQTMAGDPVEALLARAREEAEARGPVWLSRRFAALPHLLWMLDELEQGNIQGEEKIGRWVGFLQGAMWMSGYASINELRAMVLDAEAT